MGNRIWLTKISTAEQWSVVENYYKETEKEWFVYYCFTLKMKKKFDIFKKNDLMFCWGSDGTPTGLNTLDAIGAETYLLDNFIDLHPKCNTEEYEMKFADYLDKSNDFDTGSTAVKQYLTEKERPAKIKKN